MLRSADPRPRPTAGPICLLVMVALVLSIVGCQPSPTAPATERSTAPVADPDVSVTGGPEASGLATARAEIRTTIDELARLSDEISAAAAEGDAEATYSRVIVLADLVDEELDWLAAQDSSIRTDGAVVVYEAALTALDAAAQDTTPADPQPGALRVALAEILSMRAAFVAGS